MSKYLEQAKVAMSKFFDQSPGISAFLVFIFIIVIFAALAGALGGALQNTEKLNVEQNKFVGDETQTSQRSFLRFACKAKAVCKNYPDIKQGCAEAGSIQKCIDIRMKGEDSSMCLDSGEVVGFDDKTRPSFAQCAAFQVSEFLNQH